jgi:hypothetical protein
MLMIKESYGSSVEKGLGQNLTTDYRKSQTSTPMLTLIIISVVAVLFSLAWRDQPAQEGKVAESSRRNPPKT